MPVNASYEYFAAEKEYLQAESLSERIECLREMIRTAPKHKSSENLLAELRTRLRKLLEKQEKSKKTGKGKKGIRKEGFQVALVGLVNSGKSCLLGCLSNAKPKISSTAYTTKEPEIGTMDFQGVKAQLIDFPAVEGKDIDFGLINTADLLLIVVKDLEDISKVERYLDKASGKRLVVVNKVDLLSRDEKRKMKARMKSKRIYGVTASCISREGIIELKEMIFEEMRVIRIFMKEPGKEQSDKPMVLSEGASVKDVAEMIYKGFSKRVKEARLTGPSGKFANQRVGLKHKLKDKDVLEFRG